MIAGLMSRCIRPRLALSGLSEMTTYLSAFGAKRTCRDRGTLPRFSSRSNSAKPLSPILVWEQNGPIQWVVRTIGIPRIVEVVRTGIGSCDARYASASCTRTSLRRSASAESALIRSAGTGCVRSSTCTLGSRVGAQGEHRNQHNGKQRCSRHAILHHAPQLQQCTIRLVVPRGKSCPL
jgi:hypothetical protein